MRISRPTCCAILVTMSMALLLRGHQSGSATGETTPDYLAVGFVMSNYFQVLGVPMQLGRGFTPAEDDYRVGGVFVAVISNRLWRSMLGADSTVIGRTLLVNGVRVEIVGVPRRGFHGVERLDETDVWMPGAISPVINHFPAEFRTLDRVRGGYYEYVGRLAEDATFDQLRRQLDLGVAVRLASYDDLHRGGELNELLFRRVLYGISSRNYERAAEEIPGAIGLSSFTVSREFIEVSVAKLREFQERDLSGVGFVVLFLDGKSFADDEMVIALGVTSVARSNFSVSCRWRRKTSG